MSAPSRDVHALYLIRYVNGMCDLEDTKGSKALPVSHATKHVRKKKNNLFKS